MPSQPIGNRVDRLEECVTELEKLPERVTRVELQIVQLRSEMRDEFSAVRQEIRAGDEETRRQLTEQIEETRRYMRVLHEDVIGRFAALQEGRPTLRRKRKDR
jgi:archaellum component FlaC